MSENRLNIGLTVKYILFTLLSTFLILFFLELATRIYFVARSGWQFGYLRYGIPRGRSDPPKGRMTTQTVRPPARGTNRINVINLQPGTFVLQAGPPNSSALNPEHPEQAIRINNLGFRGRDYFLQKPLNTVRIIALGGSTTFGFGLQDKETWPAILERILNHSSLNGSYEVINTGITGLTSSGILELVQRRRLLDLDPDLILFYSGFNDLIAKFGFDRNVSTPLRWISRLDNALGHTSLFYLTSREWYFRWGYGSIDAGYQNRLRHRQMERLKSLANAHTDLSKTYMENLSIIIRNAHKQGIKVFLVQQAHAPLRLVHDVHELFFLYQPLIASANKELQRRYGIAIFNAQAYFDQFENPRRLFLNPKYDAIHMNASGSQALAEGLFKALRNHLPTLASP